MTLNLTEAGAVNTVIEHLTGTFPGTVPPSRPTPDRAQVILALASLADAAYRRLSAGYSGEKALEALEAHWPGALREVWMLEMHGSEAEPWAGDLPARQHALREGAWDPGTDLAWRTGRTDAAGSAKILYANGIPTLCTLWPAVIRGLDQAAEGTDGSDGARLDSAGERGGRAGYRGAACWPPIGGRGSGTPDESAAACKVCGCTEDEPCEGGCAWVTGEENTLEVDLCSACAWTIARDAIASGLYHLEETTGDTLFEARGGLIPQPTLTDQEIASLQPLMDAVEAANGDPEKLAELERQHGLKGPLPAPRPLLNENEAARLAEVIAAFEAADTPEKLDAFAREHRATVFAPNSPESTAAAADYAQSLLFMIRHGFGAGVFGLEWSFRSGGLSGPVMSETEARKHMTDLRRLYDEDTDRADYAVQLRLVGPWVDDPESPRAGDQQEPELGSRSATDNEAFSGTDQPLGERDTA